MHHLVYLGQTMEKGRRGGGEDLPLESFLRGGYLLGIVPSKRLYLHVIHCPQQGDMHGMFVRDMYRGMVCRILPQVWGLVPLEHDDSPPASHRAPGIGCRAYHR